MSFSSLREIKKVHDYYEGNDETLWSADAKVKRFWAKIEKKTFVGGKITYLLKKGE